jgi:CRP-like cAMP-binding protein
MLFLINNYSDIAQCLTYLELPAQAIVFEYGSIGDLFYIILRGDVKVLVPNQNKLKAL